MKDYLIDTHAHIDMEIGVNEESGAVVTLQDVIKEMNEFGVKKAIIPAVEIATQDKVVELANSDENIFGMVGLFPSEAKTYTPEFEAKMEKLAKNNKKIVAVGEVGLDYYWDKSFVELQKEVFIKQIKMAGRLNLPLIIHDREAHKDCFDILKEHKAEKVLFHCFSGSTEFMRECVKQGWYIALGGVVTFKNAVKIKDVAREIPLDKLVLETDSPYLTPVPFRGKPNKPAYVRYVAEEIAKIREMPYEELADITTTNTERFFGI